jgi:FG-GAP-like repeat
MIAFPEARAVRSTDAAVLSPAANTITVFLGIGDGSFQGGVAYRLQGKINSPNSITTADVNGDGKLDLIVANLNGLNAVSVFWEMATELFKHRSKILPTTPPTALRWP